MLRRLDQLLSNLGYCSRRSARDFLKSHSVLADGIRITDPSRKVVSAGLLVDGQPLDHPDVGRVSANDLESQRA